MASTITKRETSSQLVVSLRVSERKRLERFAKQEQSSPAEIIRRLVSTYEGPRADSAKQQEEELMQNLAVMLTSTLAEVNESIAKTCDKLDALHLELSKQGPA